MPIQDSKQFTSTELPLIDPKTPIRDVFSSVENHKVGAAILLERSRPAYFLNMLELGWYFLRVARDEAQPLGQEPDGAAIGDLVYHFNEHMAVVPVSQLPVEPSADSDLLLASPPVVSRVSEADGSTLGWFINRKHIAAAVTRRVRFVCDGPKQHSTFNLDSGRCPKCPGMLRVVSE